jgi:hypothetical protein
MDIHSSHEEQTFRNEVRAFWSRTYRWTSRKRSASAGDWLKKTISAGINSSTRKADMR